jgi:hypothetical protein
VKELGGTHGWRWPHEMKIMMMVRTLVMIKLRILEKKKEKKQNGLKTKVMSIGPFCFGDQDT